MKKTFLFAAALLGAGLVPVVQQIHAASPGYDGVISDTMCGKKHMMPGKSDAQCVQACVKEGSSYALVSGDKVYTLAGKPAAIAPFAGKQVHIEGAVKGTTLTVASIKGTGK